MVGAHITELNGYHRTKGHNLIKTCFVWHYYRLDSVVVSVRYARNSTGWHNSAMTGGDTRATEFENFGTVQLRQLVTYASDTSHPILRRFFKLCSLHSGITDTTDWKTLAGALADVNLAPRYRMTDWYLVRQVYPVYFFIDILFYAQIAWNFSTMTCVTF